MKPFICTTCKSLDCSFVTEEEGEELTLRFGCGREYRYKMAEKILPLPRLWCASCSYEHYHVMKDLYLIPQGYSFNRGLIRYQCTSCEGDQFQGTRLTCSLKVSQSLDAVSYEVRAI